MSPLKNLQDDCAARANGDGWFQYVTVTALRELSIAGQIADALACRTQKAGKAGVSVLVLMPLLVCEKPAMSGPLTEGSITFRVLEDPKTNNTGVTAEEAALKLLDLFHNWSPGYVQGVLITSKEAVKPSLEFSPKLAYDVTFNFPVGFTQTAKPAVPVLSYGGGLVTITTATAGAALYYTIDGTLPVKSPLNGTLYVAPFAAAAGVRVRAVAEKTDIVASHCSEITTA